MRTQLFRTPPVLIDDDTYPVTVFVKDMDGADPFDLFLENMDIAASYRTRYGSKNANLVFKAKTAGAGGNDVHVALVLVAGQPFSVVATSTPVTADPTITIRLACDAAGGVLMSEQNTAAAVMKAVNADAGAGTPADTGAATLVAAALAPGSDGSAVMMDFETGQGAFSEDLAGGADASTVGDVTLEYSPTGARERTGEDNAIEAFPGPWVALAHSFSALAAGAAKVLAVVDKPMRGLRMTAKMDAAETHLVVTAVARKKGV